MSLVTADVSGLWLGDERWAMNTCGRRVGSTVRPAITPQK